MLTDQQVLNAVALRANGTAVTADAVKQMLANVHGVTFAHIVQVTPVTLAAANKANEALKVTFANVQLFNNLSAFTSVYENAVKRTAAKIASNDAAAVDEFKSQGNYFEHTDCYSVTQHKTDASRQYLYAIFNNSESVFVLNGSIASREQVAALMSKRAGEELLAPSQPRSAAYGIEHDVHVRNVSMDNIVSITAMKQHVGM